ncbi:MAG: DUF4097 family beta strand repeat-containing protein [Bacteroidota bacterium]
MKTTVIKIIFIISFALQTGFVNASIDDQQKNQFTYTVKGSASEKTIVINNLLSEIYVEGTAGSEIKIVVSDYMGMPEKAKGLRPIGRAAENTGIGLNFNPDGDFIYISAVHRAADDARYKIYVPKNIKLKIDNTSWTSGDTSIKGLANEIEIQSMVSRIFMEDVSGPIVANTISSEIDIKFSSLNQKSPTSISSTTGDIEITLPESVKGTFKMHSFHGGVYTDIDFDLGEEDGTRRLVGQSVTGLLNGGGVEVTLKSPSGNIYIRKAK